MTFKNLLWAGAALAASVLFAQRAPESAAWGLKAVRPPPYTAPNKPLTRLTEVKAVHRGEANWSEIIVDDDVLQAEFICTSPGGKVSACFHPDTRCWWVVLEGQMRVSIEGQESFLATKGTMVQVPRQTVFSMENTGSEPAVRYEVNIAGATTFYPADVTPPKVPGFECIPVTLRRTPGPWDRGNLPHLSLMEVAGQYRASGDKFKGRNFENRFVDDDRAVVNVVYGTPQNQGPANPNSVGSYHPQSSETMMVLTGQFSAQVEGQGLIVANEGDVIYIPKMTYHNVRYSAIGPSCRMVTSGFVNNAHVAPVEKVR
jgi:mannose-6-phosphate isomerase-like protein (cupin superfamily)